MQTEKNLRFKLKFIFHPETYAENLLGINKFLLIFFLLYTQFHEECENAPFFPSTAANVVKII